MRDRYRIACALPAGFLTGPSRCAIQTGRNPFNVNVVNVPPESFNPRDPVGGYQGIPVNMSTIGNKLQGAGWETHFVGKVRFFPTKCVSRPVQHGSVSSCLSVVRCRDGHPLPPPEAPWLRHFLRLLAPHER